MLSGASPALAVISGAMTGRLCVRKDATVCISSVAESAATQAGGVNPRLPRGMRGRSCGKARRLSMLAAQHRGRGATKPSRAPAELMRAGRCARACRAEGEPVVPRHIACLSFDFDTWSGFAARGLTTPTPVSRGEFGVIGAGRILELLASRGIQASWYIPGVVIRTYPEACERVLRGGHEIGHHG